MILSKSKNLMNRVWNSLSLSHFLPFEFGYKTPFSKRRKWAWIASSPKCQISDKTLDVFWSKIESKSERKKEKKAKKKVEEKEGEREVVWVKEK